MNEWTTNENGIKVEWRRERDWEWMDRRGDSGEGGGDLS